MSTPEYNLHTPEEIDAELKSLFSEMHDLLVQSKTNPSTETSQKLVECFHKMDMLQKQIKQQIISHK